MGIPNRFLQMDLLSRHGPRVGVYAPYPDCAYGLGGFRRELCVCVSVFRQRRRGNNVVLYRSNRWSTVFVAQLILFEILFDKQQINNDEFRECINRNPGLVWPRFVRSSPKEERYL
jgi:hypothetical protein